MPHPRTDDVRRGGWRSASPYALAGLLGLAGVMHFVAPRSFASIVPPELPAPYTLVYVSGVAEMVCAAGLVVPRTRAVSGWATAALFLMVFPANVQMALDSGGRSTGYQAGAWARLPLQVPLIWWAVSVARSARRAPVQARR
jgi:uncharacterized membrane protein